MDRRASPSVASHALEIALNQIVAYCNGNLPICFGGALKALNAQVYVKDVSFLSYQVYRSIYSLVDLSLTLSIKTLCRSTAKEITICMGLRAESVILADALGNDPQSNFWLAIRCGFLELMRHETLESIQGHDGTILYDEHAKT